MATGLSKDRGLPGVPVADGSVRNADAEVDDGAGRGEEGLPGLFSGSQQQHGRKATAAAPVRSLTPI